MRAPEKFVEWMTQHEHIDKNYGWVYRYHPRSDAHSVAICEFVLSDLLDASATLRKDAEAGNVVYGINAKHQFPSGKKKTLDLAIGTPKNAKSKLFDDVIHAGEIDRVIISCEAKGAMTEHGKSQPRIFDELGSSHEIVHQGDREAIAAGITVVNIAETFISPLRQKSPELYISKHKQPHAAQRMVDHLRGLPIRDSLDDAGFDAYATVVVDCDNRSPARLWTADPAPQPGDGDHYDTFIERLAAAYDQRFGS